MDDVNIAAPEFLSQHVRVTEEALQMPVTGSDRLVRDSLKGRVRKQISYRNGLIKTKNLALITDFDCLCKA